LFNSTYQKYCDILPILKLLVLYRIGTSDIGFSTYRHRISDK